MKKWENILKKINAKYILFGIMVCFCILALIEIIYGQVQKKAEQERLAMEEANSLELLEREEDIAEISENKPQNDGMGQDLAPAVEQESGTEQGKESGEEGAIDSFGQSTDPEEAKKYDMQIVILGDSIMDSDRSEDGIAALISRNCNAKVYNMSIGGSTAALLAGEEYNYNDWSSLSLLGIVNAMVGNINGDIFQQYRAGEILKECDFSQTDYFILEYGVNDYLARVPNGRYLEDGVTKTADEAHTYVGALELAIGMLHGSFPDAKILLASPHYCQFFNGETYLGDAYSIDYGFGALITYKDMCSNVYHQHKQDNVLFYDTFAHSGIDAYTADEYLDDGIHLTEAGQRSYAEYASEIIRKDFFPEE